MLGSEQATPLIYLNTRTYIASIDLKAIGTERIKVIFYAQDY